MLAFHKSDCSDSEFIVAKNRKTNMCIYITNERDYPLQKYSGNILNLIPREFFFKNIVKRYGLKKSDIAKLKAFYREEESEELDLDPENIRLALAFDFCEKFVLNQLKKRYISDHNK